MVELISISTILFIAIAIYLSDKNKESKKIQFKIK